MSVHPLLRVVPESKRFGVWLRVVLGALGVMTGSAVTAVNPPSPFARAPYLQSAGPQHMHVVWRTEGPIQPVVRYGTELTDLRLRVKTSEMVTRAALGTNDQVLPARWSGLRTRANLALPALHSAPLGTFQYEARLRDLEPSTTYFYAIYDGDRRLTPEEASYQFTTPPSVGSRGPVRFWVLGDSGTGGEPQAAVHEAMRRTVEREGKPLDFWLHVGDMAYGIGRDMEFQSRFFESYDLTLRRAVCWPTMGNHEGRTSSGRTGIGPYYDAYVVPTRGESGGVASGTEAYYSFDHANIHFICLDSHDLDRRPTEPMARWLKADLEKTRADWIIAFWHHPAYTKGSHDSDKEKDLTEMRELVMPVIEQGGVDVVFTGHSHTYERSMLMDGAYATPTVAENVILDDGDGDPAGDGAYQKRPGNHPHEGTVQVVTGNGGANLGRVGTLPVMRKVFLEYGSVLVDVQGDTLVARMINRDGVERDLFSVVKRGQETPRRLALPWQPPAYEKPTNQVSVPAAPAIDHRVLIPADAPWRYVYDPAPRGQEWTRLGFDDSAWRSGRGAFGYGKGDFATSLGAMRGVSTRLYVRREFEIEQADRVTELGLQIDFDDAFIAYLNGREVARAGVGRSSGRNAQKVVTRTATGRQYVTLKDAHLHVRDGVNVLAIEIHNASAESSDLKLDAVLLLED
ncbi:MAG: metallophosphoesterase family protein [Verrucomicrobiales bacterium]|nr:metallophosphoesterase family protein [Verrucomicrobiales bacterium]